MHGALAAGKEDRGYLPSASARAVRTAPQIETAQDGERKWTKPHSSPTGVAARQATRRPSEKLVDEKSGAYKAKDMQPNTPKGDQ